MTEMQLTGQSAPLAAHLVTHEFFAKRKTFQAVLAGMHIPAPVVPDAKLPGIKSHRTVRTDERPAPVTTGNDHATANQRKMPACASTARYWY